MKLGLRFFMVVCCVGMQYQILVAGQDVQGRTPLMNYVITQEDAIKKNRQDIEKLWNVCYETITTSKNHYKMPTMQDQLIKQLASLYSSPYTIAQIPEVSQLSKIPQASNFSVGKGKKVVTSSTKTVRKESCTDENMRAYEQSKQDLDDLIMRTIQQIELMVQHENNLVAVDNFGKSVLNYCYTFKIYKKLRELGVPFQFDTWLYWYL